VTSSSPHTGHDRMITELQAVTDVLVEIAAS
jgi:hypothetical protein